MKIILSAVLALMLSGCVLPLGLFALTGAEIAGGYGTTGYTKLCSAIGGTYDTAGRGKCSVGNY